MTPARERLAAAALCVVGAALILLAAGQTWAEAVVVAEEGFPRVVVEATGRTLAGGGAGMGVVGLAGAVALFATRRVGRVITGVVLAAGGAFAAIQALVVARDFDEAIASPLATAVGRSGVAPTSLDTSAWPWVMVLGGLLLALGGVLAVVRGSRWPGMSRRYEAPEATAPVDPGPVDEGESSDALWKAQDRGEDPTGSDADDTDDTDGSSRS